MVRACRLPSWVRLAVAGLAWSGLAAADSSCALAQDCTLIRSETAWLFHPAPPPPDWADTGGVDDPELTGWRVGCTPFGTDGCGFVARTPWPLGSTYHVRQHVTLTGDEFGMVASIAIDNDFELHVNGVFVASLVHENCATRWDAVIPVPDAAWRVGDNVVALLIRDRGGLATFDFELTGSTTGTCPPGCAQLPCDATGPTIDAPPTSGCPGAWTALDADATWTEDCPWGLELRLVDAAGAPLGPWGDGSWWFVADELPADVVLEARCAQSATCPVGRLTTRVEPLAGRPAPLGPALRVRKRGDDLARLDWSTAAPRPGEHFHVEGGAEPDALFRRRNGERDASTSWVDPEPAGRAFYRVVPADACEREALE